MSHKIVAIGEIGLDFHYNHSPRDTQKNVFARQIEMAIERDLPIVIHSRDADVEMRSFLQKNHASLKRKGVIHSFSSGSDLAELALSLGFYLGFNGMVTFNKADTIREIVKHCPLEQMLLETDSPFLTPAPYRGRENAPSFLPLVAEKVAELKGVSPDEVLERTSANAQNLFRLPYPTPSPT